MDTRLGQRPETRSSAKLGSVRRAPLQVSPGESAVVLIAGAAGIATGILGIPGILLIRWEGIGAVVLGLGLAIEAGTSISAVRRASATPEWGPTKSTGGFTGELIFGLLGAGLGVFSMFQGGTISLTGLSIVSIGIALWTGSAALHAMEVSVEELENPGREPKWGVDLVTDTLNFGAVILGILTIYGVRPEILPYIGNLAVGSGLILSGATTARRTLGMPA